MLPRLVCLLLLAGVTGCGSLRFENLPEPSREQLQQLVDRHARQTEVTAELGAAFTLYAKGTDSWRILEGSLDRVPAEVRPLIPKYPKVVFYTTSYQYTWLFFDGTDELKEFRIGSQ
jgi:hypothetical protein